jgi:endonuclease YncB( thermonuclease family)
MSKRVGHGFLLTTIVLAAAMTAAANTGLVKKVLGGDLVQFGESFVTRLTGIRAPGLDEPLGQQVYEFTKRELEGKTVVLITWTMDSTARGIVYDEEGHPMVQIFYGKGYATNFNEVMLKKGYARVDPKYLPGDLKHYLELENEAREKGLGIWKKGSGPSL